MRKHHFPFGPSPFDFRLAIVLALGLFVGLGPPAQVADSRDSASSYGMLAFLDWDHDWNNSFSGGDKLEKSAAKIQEAGAGWVRTVFEWSDIEPEKGRYIFSKYDKILDTLDRHSLKALVTLGGNNPLWRPVEWNSAPIPEDFIAYSSRNLLAAKDEL
jgi:hypothetical protein